MSIDEVSSWAAYIQRRGTLNVGLRLEAMLAHVIVDLCIIGKIKKRGGGDFKFEDFAPHICQQTEDDEGDEEGISFELAQKAFAAIGYKKGKQ